MLQGPVARRSLATGYQSRATRAGWRLGAAGAGARGIPQSEVGNPPPRLPASPTLSDWVTEACTVTHSKEQQVLAAPGLSGRHLPAEARSPARSPGLSGSGARAGLREEAAGVGEDHDFLRGPLSLRRAPCPQRPAGRTF